MTMFGEGSGSHYNLDLLCGLYGPLEKPEPEPGWVTKLREKLGLDRCREVPFAHQVIGTNKIVNEPFVFLADEMGAGKTKQLIDAAMILYLTGVIDRVIVIAPAAVRTVWFDSELGELAKHLWETVPNQVSEYHGKIKQWKAGPPVGDRLKWIITNYDFIRDRERRRALRQYCGRKTLLVLDESSAVKSYKAQQTKSCMKLRKFCGRVVLMNGTPIANKPSDLRAQGDLLSPDILECKTGAQFRARYGVMGGFQNRNVVKWQNLDDLQKRFAPHTLRRLKSQCLDLPLKMPPVVLQAVLTPKTWAIYKEMRDDLVAWLSDAEASQASHAAVKVMRLSQITSGFIGGVKDVILDEEEDSSEMPSFMRIMDLDIPKRASKMGPVAEIGREKLDVCLQWIRDGIEADPTFKFLIWARFRPEIARLVKAIHTEFGIPVGQIVGGQHSDEREAAKRILTPQTCPEGAAGVVGSPMAGGMGLTLVATHNVLYCSNDQSLKVRLQSEDRPHRPGQVNNVNYYDIVAVGPQGQKTVDHKTILSLQRKYDLAELTTRGWIEALQEE
jgi:hypothetical protein